MTDLNISDEPVSVQCSDVYWAQQFANGILSVAIKTENGEICWHKLDDSGIDYTVVPDA